VPDAELDALRRLAERHLRPDQATTWLALLRPTVQLAPAEPGERPVARFGGTTTLPDDVDWPASDAGPLSLLLEVDLDALHAQGLGTGGVLPASGRLLAFAQADPPGVPLEPTPSSGDAAVRLLHLRADGTTGPPPGTVVHDPEQLAGHAILTWPDDEHHVWLRVGDAPAAFRQELYEAGEARPVPFTFERLAGWAPAVQSSVEHDLIPDGDPSEGDGAFYDDLFDDLGSESWNAPGNPPPDAPEDRSEEMLRWRHVLSLGARDATGFGDGVGYWFAPTTDAGGVRLDEAVFTYQNG
jgi:hypothetical protein